MGEFWIKSEILHTSPIIIYCMADEHKSYLPEEQYRLIVKKS